MNHLPEKKSAVRIVDHELGVVDVVRKRHIIASHALLFLIREVYMPNNSTSMCYFNHLA